MPFTWALTRLLLDGQGNVIHFPAGSYYAHMSDPYSVKLLDLVRMTRTIHHIYSVYKRDKGGKNLSQSQRRVKNMIDKWVKDNG